MLQIEMATQMETQVETQLEMEMETQMEMERRGSGEAQIRPGSGEAPGTSFF